jgi:SNF2 family DNA or RNA helicase
MLEVLFKNTSYNVSFLSGSMPNEDRQKTVDEFNSDPGQFVFLISTKAGGPSCGPPMRIFEAYFI